MSHDEFVTRQTIEAQEKPAAKLLVERVVTVAHRCLRHLCNERLGITQQQVQNGASAVDDRMHTCPLVQRDLLISDFC